MTTTETSSKNQNKQNKIKRRKTQKSKRSSVRVNIVKIRGEVGEKKVFQL